MKTAYLLSRLVFSLTAISPLQLAQASPPSSSGDSETLVITQNGSVKFKGELDGGDMALRVIPLTSTDNGTLTVGHVAPPCSNGVEEVYGFASGGGAFGSYSPTLLTGGVSAISIADNTPVNFQRGCGYSAFSELTVSGFSSNPGSAWLSSITCNGVENTGSGGSFSYSGGIAEWVWSTQFSLAAKNGSNVSCSIVHG